MSESNKTAFTRRQLLSGGVVAGVATMLSPLAMVGCGDESVTSLPIPRDVQALLRTLTLDESFLIADPRTGRFYRLDQRAGTVTQLDASGATRWTFGATGDMAMRLNFPTDIAPRPDGSLYVVDSGNRRVVQLSADGAWVRAIETPGAPRTAVVDADGALWVIDRTSHQVRSFSASGAPGRAIAEAGVGATQLNGPRGLAIDAAGNLHVVDAGNARVQVYSRTGAHVRSYGSRGAEAGKFLFPRSVAVAPNGLSYVSDPTAGTVEVFESSGRPLARLEGLMASGRAATPLDVSIRPNGLVQVRLYAPVRS